VLRCTHCAVGALFLLACATAGEGDDGTTGRPDAGVTLTPDAPAFPSPPDAIPTADADPLPPQPDAAPGAPDAAPGAPDAAPCTDTVVQLLTNANFDSGPGGGWVEQSMYALINPAAGLPAAIPPQSGTHAVWMGGDYLTTDKLYQDVAVPAGATNLELVGYRWIASEETGATPYDTVILQVRSTADATLETLATWSNVDKGTAWTAFTLPATGSYGGQTVRVYLESNTDSTLNTNFFFDTFALRVTVCQ
jgi:hypothetical protein